MTITATMGMAGMGTGMSTGMGTGTGMSMGVDMGIMIDNEISCGWIDKIFVRSSAFDLGNGNDL